ncbi:MAG TPA: hypothetical protein VET47_00045, partial [Candidatus Limnocylindrales bacterium]|nr:hypothetical protein [Candidatus Limnocylindrales bacterium]
NYRKVPPDAFGLVKRSLKREYILSQYPSLHDSMVESFDIVSLDGKISVYYYKDGTLQIEGDETNPAYRRIVKIVNGLISKKDYI